MKAQFIHFASSSLFLFILISCNVQIDNKDVAVWNTVENRMLTWKERDKDGQLKIYHPDFRRWAGEKLQTKETFLANWDLVDTRINDIQIEKIELQYFKNAQLSVAHYRITEKLEWIGKDFQEANFKRITGQVWTENYLASDYYIKEKSKWLYIGGLVKQIK